MSKKWNEDETLKFIQLYREHECLWDKRCDAYKNKQMRASALEALRDGMTNELKVLTINEIKAKIKSIRNTYYLEIDKIEKSTRSGAGGNVYKPKVIWFDEYDSFVKPVTVRRKTTDNTEVSHSSEPGSSPINTPRSTENENGVENDSTAQTPRETQQERPQETRHETPQETSQFTPPIKKSKRSKLSQLSDMIKDLRNISDDNTNTSICSEETDLDLFGKSVSAQMKTLSEVQAVIAKEKIQSVLTQCRLTDIRAKNAHSFGTPQFSQSVQQSQDMSSIHWNPTQVFTSYPVSQTCLPPAQSPADTSSTSTSFQYSDNTTVYSTLTPYNNNDSQDENAQDVIQFAFNNA